MATRNFGLGPQIRVSAQTVVSMPRKNALVVNSDGTLTDQFHQYLYSVGSTINNVEPGSGYAPLTSPSFQGIPAAPTAVLHDNTTQIATDQFVENEFASPPVIGSLDANAAAFTTVQIADTKTTTLEATGLITPTSTIGIAGTTTNDNVEAGSIGEEFHADGSLALTSGAPASVAFLPLTAGDWELSGSTYFTASVAVSVFNTGINTVSTALPAAPFYTGISATSALFTSGSWSTPVQRVSIPSNITYYLVALANFVTGTVTVNSQIHARRAR